MTRERPLPAELGSGPFRVRRARELGVTADMLRRSSLRTPMRGVRVSVDLPRTVTNDCLAALTVVPPGAAFSHVTALRLLGADLPASLDHDGRVHVTVPPGAPVSRRPELCVHTCVRPLVLLRRDGLTFVTPETAWTQVVGGLDLDDAVVLTDALMRRTAALSDERALRAELDAAGRFRGVRRARAALVLARPRTDSVMETRARLVLVRSGLPCPEVNRPVLDARGQFVALPDMSYPSERIAIEYDGDVHRTDRPTWLRDVERREHLEDLGWRTITCTADDVLRHPARFVTRVRRALSASSPA